METHEPIEPEKPAVRCTGVMGGGMTEAIDDDHHAMMNGPRIAQSLPASYLAALLEAARKCETPPIIAISNTDITAQ